MYKCITAKVRHPLQLQILQAAAVRAGFTSCSCGLACYTNTRLECAVCARSPPLSLSLCLLLSPFPLFTLSHCCHFTKRSRQFQLKLPLAAGNFLYSIYPSSHKHNCTLHAQRTEALLLMSCMPHLTNWKCNSNWNVCAALNTVQFNFLMDLVSSSEGNLRVQYTFQFQLFRV